MSAVCNNRDSESLFCKDKISWNILMRGLRVVLSGRSHPRETQGQIVEARESLNEREKWREGK